MADEGLILWGERNFVSPYVFSCFVALREKRLDFELRTMSLDAGEHREGDYPARSLTGRVPALQHGDFWLAESSAIDEYLEELFPPPAYTTCSAPACSPTDPAQPPRSRPTTTAGWPGGRHRASW